MLCMLCGHAALCRAVHAVQMAKEIVAEANFWRAGAYFDEPIFIGGEGYMMDH